MNQKTIIFLVNFVEDEQAYAVGNEDGRAVFAKLSHFVDNHPDHNIFGVSLKGIKFTDASFPRESVISLAKLYRGEKGFFLQDFISKDLEDNWSYAADAKDQPMIIWRDDGSYKLLGPKITASTLAILDYIHQQGEVTTSKVASKFALSTQNASGKLKKMFNQGLILGSMEVAESGGLEFIYQAIK